MNNKDDDDIDKANFACWRQPQAVPKPCTNSKLNASRRPRRRATTKSRSITPGIFLLTTIAAVSMLYIRLIAPVPQPFILAEAFIVNDHPQPQVSKCPYRHRMTATSPFLLLSPSQRNCLVKVHSNVATKPQTTEVIPEDNDNENISNNNDDDLLEHSIARITSAEVKLRMEKQLERLKLKDRLSPKLSNEVCVCE